MAANHYNPVPAYLATQKVKLDAESQKTQKERDDAFHQQLLNHTDKLQAAERDHAAALQKMERDHQAAKNKQELAQAAEKHALAQKLRQQKASQPSPKRGSA